MTMIKTMTDKKVGGSIKFVGIMALIVMLVITVFAFLRFRPEQKTVHVSKDPAKKARMPVKLQTVINYNKLDTDEGLKALTAKRKAEYGIEGGVDLIAKSDELLKIGDSNLSMQEIAKQIHLKRGDIIEDDILDGNRGRAGRHDSEPDCAGTRQKVQTFGIYVVKSGDNIWNIHFKFLKSYFDHKGVSLSPLADEPDRGGLSSGVGKLLKFSEDIVYIYNIKERRLDTDINLIRPLNKIVVYNMDQIFKLLDQIDYNNVNRIQFDGETLWLPSEQ